MISLSACRISRPVAWRGVHRVARIVDRALFVEMAAGEIELRVAEDRLGQPGLVQHQLRPEHRHRLQMRAAVQPLLQLAQEGRSRRR